MCISNNKQPSIALNCFGFLSRPFQRKGWKTFALYKGLCGQYNAGSKANTLTANCKLMGRGRNNRPATSYFRHYFYIHVFTSSLTANTIQYILYINKYWPKLSAGNRQTLMAKPEISPMLVNMIFLVEKAAVGQVFCRILHFLPVHQCSILLSEGL